MILTATCDTSVEDISSYKLILNIRRNVRFHVICCDPHKKPINLCGKITLFFNVHVT